MNDQTEEEIATLRAIAKRIAEMEPEPVPYGSDECFFCRNWTGKHAEDCAYERAVDAVRQFNIK